MSQITDFNGISNSKIRRVRNYWLVAVFAPKFWAHGGDLQRPFAALWMYMGWGFYLQVVGTPHHHRWYWKFFLSQVVETLKPSIIFICPILPCFTHCFAPCFTPCFAPCFAPCSPPVLFPHLMPLMVVGTLHCSILVGTLQPKIWRAARQGAT